jgi:hypothetical protein
MTLSEHGNKCAVGTAGKFSCGWKCEGNDEGMPLDVAGFG